MAPAAASRTAASTGSSRRAGPRRTSSRTGRRAWFMIRSADQALLRRGDARPVRQAVRGGGRAADVEVEVEFSGGATTMNHNRRSRSAGTRTPSRTGSRRGHGPSSGSTDMANVSWVVRRSTRSSRSPSSPPRATRSSSATRPPVRSRTARPCSPRRSSPRRRWTSSLDPALVREAWREFPRRGVGVCGARPAGRMTRTGGV